MPSIAICAPSRSLTHDDADRVTALAAEFPGLQLHFHEQCFFNDGHFAGSDAQRLAALLECANDPAFDAVWFARGGYGAARIAEDALARMNGAAGYKTWLGYSDGGMLLGGLYARDVGKQVHAPMPTDIRREGGEAAVRRTLAYLAGDLSGVEPGLDHRPQAAFNLMTL
ncbi:MAG: LD-carboxypeptidase, partial [Novosphingobium sp.]